MIILLICLISVIVYTPHPLKLLTRNGFILLFVFELSASLNQNAMHYLPDTRIATVEWFSENAPLNSQIGTDVVLYEFGELNVYIGEKRFSSFHIPDILG